MKGDTMDIETKLKTHRIALRVAFQRGLRKQTVMFDYRQGPTLSPSYEPIRLASPLPRCGGVDVKSIYF